MFVDYLSDAFCPYPYKNEEQDLPECLSSVTWSSDIVVFDSCSTDRTREIAESAGARVIQKPFDNWSSHQNWGLRNIAFRYPWIFYIDADERLTPEAAAELQAIARSPDPDCVAYRIRRRDFFQGSQLRYVQTSPWYIRFFRPEFVHYERLVNPLTVVDGPVGELQYPLDHYPFSKVSIIGLLVTTLQHLLSSADPAESCQAGAIMPTYSFSRA